METSSVVVEVPDGKDGKQGQHQAKVRVPEISLDDLVANSRRPPLTGENFRKFLAAKFCEENFVFLVEAQRYRDGVSKNGPSEESRQQLEMLLSQFIAENAEQQVNVSAQLRNETLRKAENAKAADAAREVVAAVFDAAAREIASILRSANYVTSFVRESAQNITAEEANIRYVIAFVSLLISVAIGALLILSNTSRWIRLVCLLPNFLGFSYLWSANCKV